MTSTYETLLNKYAPTPTEYLSTGIANLDFILGGGWPRGRIVEIHSEAGIGKTSILLQSSVNNMEDGHRVLFLDVENSLSETLKHLLGVAHYEKPLEGENEPRFVHLSPVSFDEIDEILQIVLKDPVGFDLIVLDSITMAVADRPKGQEKKISAEEAGHGARVQARFLKLYKGLLARAGTTMVILNQMRTNLKHWNAQVKPAGGKALEFVADIRMGLYPGKAESSGDEGSDQKTKKGKKDYPLLLHACAIKNKHTTPFRPVPLLFTPGMGVDRDASLAQLMMDLDLIEGSGGWYQHPDEDKKVRRKEIVDWVRDEPDEARRMLLAWMP